MDIVELLAPVRLERLRQYAGTGFPGWDPLEAGCRPWCAFVSESYTSLMPLNTSFGRPFCAKTVDKYRRQG